MAFFAVLCIILTVYFPVPAHAGNDREQLPFESNHMAQYYDVSTGYPVSEANDAAQTTDGFMYLACYGGLLRFDGTDFVRIPAISNAVSLYPEEDGGLWVGTNDSGLAYMSPEWEFTFYGLESGLPGLSVRGIEKDSRGNLLLATSGGLCLRDKETGAITQIGAEEIQGQLVYNLTEDYGSGFWCMIGDDNIGCWRQDGTFEMWNARDLGFLPQCVVPDRENPGYIYIGTKKDDIRYGKVGEDFFTFKTIRVPDIGSINNVCNVDGRIWILGEYGIAQPAARYLKAHPDVELTLIFGNTQDLLHRLDQGELDFALVEGYYPPGSYDHLLFRLEPFVPVAAASHAFVREPELCRDLLGERLLVREPGSGTRNILERNLALQGLTLDQFAHRIQIGNMHALIQLLEEDCGITFLYRIAVEKEIADGRIRLLPLKDFSIVHPFDFIWPKDSIFAPEFQEICRELKG